MPAAKRTLNKSSMAAAKRTLRAPLPAVARAAASAKRTLRSCLRAPSRPSQPPEMRSCLRAPSRPSQPPEMRSCLRARFSLAPPQHLRGDQSPGTLFADVEMEILDVATPRPPKRFRFAGAVAAPGDGFQESFHCGALTRDELRSPPPCAPSADDLGDDDHDWHMELASAPSFGFASRS